MKTEDSYLKRAKEIVNDKWQEKLLYMIGGEHEIDKETINRDKKKKYFIELIVAYLKKDE